MRAMDQLLEKIRDYLPQERAELVERHRRAGRHFDRPLSALVVCQAELPELHGRPWIAAARFTQPPEEPVCR